MEEDGDSERTPSLSSAGGGERRKSAEFRPPADAPPAYSLAALCARRNTRRWNSTIVAVGAGIAALVVCLLVGGLLFEVGRLNGVIAEMRAENERLFGMCEVKKAEWKSGRQETHGAAEESTAEVQECWTRVANVTKELADQKQTAAARNAQLQAEASEAKAKHSEEKAEMERKVDELEDQLRKRPVECPSTSVATSTPTALVSFNLTATNGTSFAGEEDCSAFCRLVMRLDERFFKAEERGRYTTDKTWGLLFALFLIAFGALILAAFVWFLCSLIYTDACKRYGQRPPPFPFWRNCALAIGVPALLIVVFSWGVTGLRDLINLCFE
ncbi:hypothetical protein M3Y99_00481900 [Aphelenchoides fujianensis]|nr:hypothetical protein M3Y99_00481900 [Aphelenchoides fujianensis]